LIQNDQRKHPIDRPMILRWAEQILLLQKYPEGIVGLHFMNDRQIQAYNRDYRHKDQPTNVLAFAMQDGEGSGLNPELLGDVMISLPTLAREAKELGRSERRHLLILLIHGMLHLMGYDHERSEAEARRMKRRENLLLKRLWEEN
jgi:rRNA maturation RNase YbeY